MAHPPRAVASTPEAEARTQPAETTTGGNLTDGSSAEENRLAELGRRKKDAVVCEDMRHSDVRVGNAAGAVTPRGNNTAG